MTVEFVFFIAVVAALFNTISLWAIIKLRDANAEINHRLWTRINYLEVAMSHHGMIPMPWEVEELEDIVEEIKTFKKEGNVVYLQSEE